ncbi:Protein of uncharacterised function (DUF2813) [Citrobacter freundii]|nr:Protein of uncharacterised function (DUF2813) [Citrobacter freundii]
MARAIRSPLDDINDQARHLVRLMPVLRLRDARFMRRIRNGTVPDSADVEVTARQLDFLARELATRPQNLTDGQIRQGLSAMVQLLEHYFSEQGSGQSRYRLMRRRSNNEQRSWRYLDIINRMIDKPGGRTHRVILLGLFSTLLQAKGTLRLDKDARPLLLVEDPETRLHPDNAVGCLAPAEFASSAAGWRQPTPVNSCPSPLWNTLSAWCVSPPASPPGGLGQVASAQKDGRRIAFHIRFNRASSLFARCWLLVEGETETWVINELARQCGHHFDAEGIKVIEFAPVRP